ncbi:hypothetical protein GUJ93_ZPchr0845g18762 [Zizania palustris]|uniref:Uncharacterized protein n=1 Tax=Zizania palustris TaxID=103762 RepID=A0A8J5QZI9_ZIZPA|nr:hypothetical protein GUJ93_ZPchr0845g18762 [Zizania palustris]
MQLSHLPSSSPPSRSADRVGLAIENCKSLARPRRPAARRFRRDLNAEKLMPRQRDAVATRVGEGMGADRREQVDSGEGGGAGGSVGMATDHCGGWVGGHDGGRWRAVRLGKDA